MRMRNMHYVFYFATFYLSFLFSKSCPIILKFILEYYLSIYLPISYHFHNTPYTTHHMQGGSRLPCLPASNLPQNLQILPALTTPAQEDAESTPNITQLLAKLQPPQLSVHIPEKPAAQQVFLGHGLPPLPKALVDRILAGCYIDFADLPPAKGKIRLLPAPEGSVILVNAYDYFQQCRLIPNLATWLQCCALYTAVICSHNPG